MGHEIEVSTETREAQGRTATVDRFLKNLDNSDLDVEEAPTDEEDSEDSSEEASAQVELEPGVDDRGGDPVRTYLRQMGAAPLLTREGEVSIARRIERGRRLIRRTIFANPVALREIVTLAEQVGGGARSIREICTVDDGDDGQGAKGSDALIAQLKSFEDLAARVESARARLRRETLKAASEGDEVRMTQLLDAARGQVDLSTVEDFAEQEPA